MNLNLQIVMENGKRQSESGLLVAVFTQNLAEGIENWIHYNNVKTLYEDFSSNIEGTFIFLRFRYSNIYTFHKKIGNLCLLNAFYYF